MVIYNTQNVTNATNIIQSFSAANALSGGYFVDILLGALWIIFFITLKYYNTSDALLASTGLTFIIAFMMWSMPTERIVDSGTMMFWFAALVGMGIVTYFRDQI